MKTRRLIIDTDTASDDAVALIMATRWPHIKIDALTIVSGNVPLKQASINARYTLQICGVVDIPVYNGCDRPLMRRAEYADWYHGPDGMGNMNYPTPEQNAKSDHAVTELIRRFKAEPGEITLVTLGPLTNIATALRIEPELAKWVKHCYIMGGAACTIGNVTPAAEYNMWVDPEAATIVFHSGLPITMIGWELSTGDANLFADEVKEVYGFETNHARLAMDCNKHAVNAAMKLQGQSGMALADPVAMAVVLDPVACTRYSNHFVDISCDAELTRGMTVVDLYGVMNKGPNVEVCWELDAARFKEILYQTLR